MAAPVSKDQEVELDVESLAYGGNGVARLNGYVVFVRRGLPGDRVRARVTKVKRNHAEALAVGVVAPGPQRGHPPRAPPPTRSASRCAEHTSALQAPSYTRCRTLLDRNKHNRCSW